MSEQKAELFQILIGQIGKDAEINPVLIEGLGVLAKTESGKPLCDLLHCRPSRHFANASSFSKPMRDHTRDAYFWPPTVVAVLYSIEFYEHTERKVTLQIAMSRGFIPEIATCPCGMRLSDKLSRMPSVLSEYDGPN
jgi:hypothetical protein